MDCEPRCRSKAHAFELNCAVTKGSFDEAKGFLQRCHNFGRNSDVYGRTILHMAATCGREDLVAWILSTGKCDINQKDKESGWTALHRAVFYGHIEVAIALIRAGASLTIRDNEGLMALGIAMKDFWCFPFVQVTKGGLLKYGNSDVYTWGDNSNYTLGHPTEQNRHFPDVVEFFRKQEISIQEVVITKYHSLFLSCDGRVFACGHGLGGRLGLGHEEAAFQPTRVSSLTSKCTKIAAGRDHSLFLMECGTVYGCGSNEYHQLGDPVDGSRNILTPKVVVIKSLRGKGQTEHVVGICAGRYHSAFYTTSSLFTVGLNAGQLGHPRSDSGTGADKFQKYPRLVSTFQVANIKQVCCSDAATAVLTSMGDVYVLHEYQCRKVSRCNFCVQIAVSGGHLDHKLDPDVLQERGGSELVVCVLGKAGKVYMWREAWQSFALLDWCLGRQLTVSDMALSNYDILICTSDGEEYRSSLCSFKNDRLLDDERGHYTAIVHSSGSAGDIISKRVVDVRAHRVPGVHKAVLVALDHKSRCFAVLQAQSIIENSFVAIPDSTLVQDFKVQFESGDLYDVSADIHILVNSEVIPAHRYILASGSEYFRSRIIESPEVELPLTVSVGQGTIVEALQYVLKFLYSGQLDIAALGELGRMLCHGATSPSSLSGSSSVSSQPVHWGQAGRDAYGGRAENASAECALKVIKEAAGVFKVKGLADSISSVVPHKGGFMVTKTITSRLHFSRDRFPQLHDVILKTSDGHSLPCHKCVLTARLEYFRTMLSCSWMEGCTSRAEQSLVLSLPVPLDVLRVVIDYLYTDDLVYTDSRRACDVDFLCNVLVLADQWLIERLKAICEARLVSQLTHKNVCALLTFASVYGAVSLAQSCKEFFCFNLPSMLELSANSRAAGGNNEDEDGWGGVAKRGLSYFYHQHLPCMACRQVTPYSADSPSAEQLQRAVLDAAGGIILHAAPSSPSKSSKAARRKERLSSVSSACSVDEDQPAATALGLRLSECLPQGVVAIDGGCGNHAAENVDSALVGSQYCEHSQVSEEWSILSRLVEETSPKCVVQPTTSSLSIGDTAAVSLRDIICAEEAARTAGSEGQSNQSAAAVSKLLNVKSGKVSQRDKKRQAAIVLTSPVDTAAVVHSLPSAAGYGRSSDCHAALQQQRAWGATSASPSVSLRDVMTTESKSAAASKTAVHASKVHVASRSASHNGNVVHTEARQLEVKVEPSAWGRSPASDKRPVEVQSLLPLQLPVQLPRQPTAQPQTQQSFKSPTLLQSTFQQIVDMELRQSEALKKIANKPLALIQIEEAAIQELYSYYQSKASCPEEQVLVERVPTLDTCSGPVTPAWAARATARK